MPMPSAFGSLCSFALSKSWSSFTRVGEKAGALCRFGIAGEMNCCLIFRLFSFTTPFVTVRAGWTRLAAALRLCLDKVQDAERERERERERANTNVPFNWVVRCTCS